MKKTYIFLTLMLVLYSVNIQAIIDMQLYKKTHSIVDLMKYYRSYIKSNNISEQIFFINLSESLAMDYDTISRTNATEQNCVQELRDFYMNFAFAYESEKEDLITKFTSKYNEIYQVLHSMSRRLV